MAVRDYSSIYTIEDWLVNEIAPGFFDMSQVSLMNVGQFGMNNHVIATVVEDQFEVVDRYINEVLPQKANLPDFIYANAALYGIEDFLARPSHASMLLYIKESDILTKSTYRRAGKTVVVAGKSSYVDYRDFRIDSEMQIFVNDVQYSIPYDVNIQVSEIDRNGKKERSYIATWVMDNKNSIAEITSPYIKIYKSVYDNDVWLVLKLDIYQYTRIPYTEPILTNSKLNIPYFETPFSNQLCNFEVFYQAPGSTELVQLEKRLESSVALTTPFIYYKIIDDNTVRFSFANDDRYFVPDYNSSIRVYMYETIGKDGDFKIVDEELGVTAQVSLSTSDESLAYNRSTTVIGFVGTDSTGGRTRLNVQDIKDLTCAKVLTIDSITTDTDLMMFSKNYAAVYQTNPVFIKYRDDVAGREYGCYIRLTDGVDIFPANTPNLLISADDADSHFPSLKQYTIKPGKRYCYASDNTNQVVRLMSPDEPTADVEYTSIFLSVIQTKPNAIRYYLNTVDKNVSLEYSYINNFSYYNFVVSNCSIKRNAVKGEDAYRISLTIARVDGVVEGINVDDEIMNNEKLAENLKVIIAFDTNEGHYLTMNLMSADHKIGFYTFESLIYTDDMIDDTRICLTNLKDNETGEEQYRIVDMTNPSVHFCVFFKYSAGNMTHNYQQITEVKDHTLCNEYIPYPDEFYFALPMTLTRSHIVFENMGGESGFGFLIKQTPLLGYDFIMNDDSNVAKVTNNLASFYSFIMGTLMKVTPNFNINIKFFNTYGRSKMFYIGEKQLLDYVHLRVRIGVKFVPGIDEAAYLEKLQIYVKDFVENLNVVKEGTNKIEESVLIHKIHMEFDEQIEYLIFYQFNDYAPDIQVIELNGLLPSETTPETVPEFITLKKDDVTIIPL